MNNKIDFLPADYLEKKSQRRINMVCLLLFIFVVSGVGAGFFVTEQKRKHLQTQLQQVNQKMLETSKTMQRLDLLEKQKKDMLNKAAISASLMEKVPRTLILAIITNDLPAGVSLVDYKMVTKELKTPVTTRKSRNKRAASSAGKKKGKPTPVILPPKTETTIEITGLSNSDIEVAQLIAQLNKSPLFKQVNLILSEEHKIDKEILRQFKLQAVLDNNAQASSKDVQMAQKMHVSGM